LKNTAFLFALALGLAGAIATPPAYADTLYSNGPSTNNFTGWYIEDGYSIAASFTLSEASTVTGADFNAWLLATRTLSSVDYAITTDPFGGTTEASGTVYPTGILLETNMYGYDIYLESFSISSMDLAAGTYYFQLENAVVPGGDPVWWDINNGPSDAFNNHGENVNGQAGSGSNSTSFNIYGDSNSVTPEPSSFLLLGSGLAGLAGLLKRKLAA
jgi:hypothetical protein